MKLIKSVRNATYYYEKVYQKLEAKLHDLINLLIAGRPIVVRYLVV